jgi:hypothetical protein
MSGEATVVVLHLILRWLEIACALALAVLVMTYIVSLFREEH